MFFIFFICKSIWLRLRGLLCLRQHVTTTRPKSEFWGIFDSTVTLTLDLLIHKFHAFIFAPKSVSGKSLVKFRQQIQYPRYLANNDCSGLTNAWMDGQTIMQR